MVTATAPTERLVLRLAVSAPGHEPAPLELDAPADATVGAALEGIAHALRLLRRLGYRLQG